MPPTERSRASTPTPNAAEASSETSNALRRDAFSRRRTLIRIIARSQDSPESVRQDFSLRICISRCHQQNALVRPPPPPNAAEACSKTSN
ncbi:hypothetical protein CEXT_785651 [Caerostris extrusa]|uniref:Uncharacterized protein n=1 Tax=Caerostris extrusa TaxID=172846 RepID=A0AAV4MK09_CAEEX|nr:hypothetical protein CEXT_785651 [Caerostris extrusa]